MAKTRDYMDYLDENIQIAPANSQEEYQAAETIAEVLRDHELETTIEEFDAHPMAKLVPAILTIILLVCLLVAGFTEGAIHVVMLLCAIAVAGYNLYVHYMGANPMENFGPASRSQNVVAVHRATGDKVVKGARPIVIVAHYDTPREDLLTKGPLARYKSMFVGIATPCTIAIAASVFLQLLMFLPPVFRTVMWAISLIAVLPLLLVAVATIYGRVAPCTEGANDNKSSVAALLSIANAVRPGPDRVDGMDEQRPRRKPRARATDEQQQPMHVEPRRVEVVEEVRGIRHGSEVLSSLGILPPDCEIVYVEPHVQVIEEPAEQAAEALDDESALPQADSDAYQDANDTQADEQGLKDSDKQDESAMAFNQDDESPADEVVTEDESQKIDGDEQETDRKAEDSAHADEADEGEETAKAVGAAASILALPTIDSDEPDDRVSERDESDSDDNVDSGDEDDEEYDEYEDDYSDEEYDDEYEEYDEEYDEEYVEEYDEEDDEEEKKPGIGGWFSERIANIREFFSKDRGSDVNIDRGEDWADEEGWIEDYDEEEYDEEEYVEEEYEDESDEQTYESSDDEDASEDDADDAVDEDVEQDYEQDEVVVYEDEEYDSEEEQPVNSEDYEEEEHGEGNNDFEYEDDEYYDNEEEYIVEEDEQEEYEEELVSASDSRTSEDAYQEEESKDEVYEEVNDEGDYEEYEEGYSEEQSEEEQLEQESYGEKQSFGQRVSGFFKRIRISDEDVAAATADDDFNNNEEEAADSYDESDDEYASDEVYEDAYDEADFYEDESEDSEQALRFEPLEDVRDYPQEEYYDEDPDAEYEEEPYPQQIDEQPYYEAQYEEDSYEEADLSFADDDAFQMPATPEPAPEPKPEPLEDPNLLHFDREQDVDVPKDDSGLSTISDSYDLYSGEVPRAAEYEKPEPLEDPTWGMTSYQPARPSINIARRAALFDLPDPSASSVDPFEDDYEEYDDEFDSYEQSEAESQYVEEQQPEVEVEPILEERPEVVEQPVADEQPEVVDQPVVDEQPEEPSQSEAQVMDQNTNNETRSSSNKSFWGSDANGSANWKGGATTRSDLADDEEPIYIDAEDLQDAILQMGDEFLIAHDIWFVATGASEASNAGMQAFVDAHRKEIRGAFVVNLDCIGSGALSLFVREGVHQPRRADRRLVRMITGIAQDLHTQIDTAVCNWGDRESIIAMRSRLRAVTITGLDHNNLPALSHTPDDVSDNVDPRQVSDVVRIVTELIRRS